MNISLASEMLMNGQANIKIDLSVVGKRYVDREMRLKVILPIVIKRQGGGRLTVINTYTRNVSQNGVCFVITPEYLDLKININDELTVYSRRCLLSAKGTVRHITEKMDGTRYVGVELDEQLYQWLIIYRLKRPDIIDVKEPE